MINRIVFAAAFSFFLAAAANAAMVSFFVIEAGLPENAGSNQHSAQWENAFMDVFFDAGYIISNAPVLRVEAKPAGDLLTAACDIHEARAWGIDYILVALLDYNTEMRIPEKISFLIYKVTSNERLFERQIDGKTYRSSREEYDDIKTIIRGLVPYIR